MITTSNEPKKRDEIEQSLEPEDQNVQTCWYLPDRLCPGSCNKNEQYNDMWWLPYSTRLFSTLTCPEVVSTRTSSMMPKWFWQYTKVSVRHA